MAETPQGSGETKTQHPTPNTQHPTPKGGYETRDLGFRAVLTFLVFLLVAMVAFMLITLGAYRLFVPPEQPSATAPSRWAEVRPLPPPTEPRLQAYAPDNPDNDPARQIKKFHAEEDKMLRSYGWVNQNAGTVHIPINRAMELMIERGMLKSRQQAATQAAGSGQQAAGENPQPAIPNPKSEGVVPNENTF